MTVFARTASITAALGLTLVAATAGAHNYGKQQPTQQKETVLPKDAYARKWNGSGANALIIPTYNERNAPKTIVVKGREYRRESFNYMQSGQRTFMAYTETADSSIKNAQAAYKAQEQKNRRNSW